MPSHLGYGNSRSVARSAQASPQQTTITFIGAYGERFPISRRTARKIGSTYAASNGESPTAEAESDGFEESPSLASLVREESRRREEMLALEKREKDRYHDGHHFGGYHPGKNARQGPSIRYVGDVSKFSELVGLPVPALVSVGTRLQELEEQQEYGAWAAQVVASNGHHK
ncbi:hypothetical protein HYV83_02215 [Candidatus Woesearchaeota archaeon]|nr:hypothetical protein [Candidatus Woesearchaeota archaeon]